VTGLQKTLSDNKVINHFRKLRLVEKLFIQGVAITVLLIVVQVLLNDFADSITVYMPPIGFAMLMAVTYFAQPLLLGALNILMTNILYKTRGWQVGFWLNGFFLLLTFTTINVLLEMVFQLEFLPYVALIDLLLSFPLGCIARFSNGGWNKTIN
jgi:hypothetical protein